VTFDPIPLWANLISSVDHAVIICPKGLLLTRLHCSERLGSTNNGGQSLVPCLLPTVGGIRFLYADDMRLCTKCRGKWVPSGKMTLVLIRIQDNLASYKFAWKFWQKFSFHFWVSFIKNYLHFKRVNIWKWVNKEYTSICLSLPVYTYS